MDIVGPDWVDCGGFTDRTPGGRATGTVEFKPNGSLSASSLTKDCTGSSFGMALGGGVGSD